MERPDDFDYGDQLAPGRGPRVQAALAVGLFLLCTFGTGLADAFFPVEEVKLKGKEAQQRKLDRVQAKLEDGTRARLFEDDLRLHSRVRSWVMPTYSYYKFVYLKEVPTGLIAGADHWVFWSNRTQLNPADQECQVGSLANAFVALDRRLSGNGIELICMPIPRKAWVAQQFLPAHIDPALALDNSLIDGLIERGVTTVDLRGVLTDVAPDEAFFPLDSHWTPASAKRVALVMASTAGALKPEDQRLGELELRPAQHMQAVYYDGLRAMGVDPKRRDLSALALAPVRMNKVKFSKRIAKHFRDPKPITPNAYSGTSYSSNTEMASLVSHFIGMPVFESAFAGGSLMNSMARLLDAYANVPGALKRVYFETPIGSNLGYFQRGAQSFPLSVSRALAAHEPEHTVELGPLAQGWITVELGPQLPLAEATLLNIPPGYFAHSGDGVIALHIKGTQTPGLLSFAINVGKSAYNYVVTGEDFEFHLPLLASETGTPQISVRMSASPNAKLTIDQIGLVHQPVGEQSQSLRPAPIDGGFSLTPTGELILGRRAALLIRISSPDRERTAVTLRIHIEGLAAPREIQLHSLYGDASLTFDLGQEAHAKLTEVELIGLGKTTTIQSATVTGQSSF